MSVPTNATYGKLLIGKHKVILMILAPEPSERTRYSAII
jgi:hypothetical protein